MCLKTYWFAMRCLLNALHIKMSVSSVHLTHLSTNAEQAKLRRHHLAFLLFIFFNYSSPQLVLISLIATLFFNNFPFVSLHALTLHYLILPPRVFLFSYLALFYCYFLILLPYLISNIIMWYGMLLKFILEYYFKLYYYCMKILRTIYFK